MDCLDYIILLFHFCFYYFLSSVSFGSICSSIYNTLRYLLVYFYIGDFWPPIQQIIRYPIISLIFSKYGLKNIVLQQCFPAGRHSPGDAVLYPGRAPEHLERYYLNSAPSGAEEAPRQHGTQGDMKWQIEVSKKNKNWGKVCQTKGTVRTKGL